MTCVIRTPHPSETTALVQLAQRTGLFTPTEAQLLLERDMWAANARVVVVETSSGASLARARSFYSSRAYIERGRIPDFYARGEAKILFSKSL